MTSQTDHAATASRGRDGSARHRVVITGTGAITCLGGDVASTWASMRDARSGIGHYDTGPFEGYPGEWSISIAGEIKGLDTSAYLEPREAKKLDRSTLFGMGAAHQAVAQSGLDFEQEDGERCGVVIGSGIGGIGTIENSLNALRDKGSRRVNPFTVPKLMVNATAGNVSIRYGLQGPASAHATACASSGHAIGDAMRYIRRGECDVMLAGGVEAAITPLCVASFSVMKALSARNDDPEKASRPFDQGRDGFVMAEGGAVFVLESLEHATARGATILGELVGFGNSCDSHHITAPDPRGTGATRSMKWAMSDAGIEPGEVDYINAHGTSTPLGDEAEVAAVLGLFGDHARKSAGGLAPDELHQGRARARARRLGRDRDDRLPPRRPRRRDRPDREPREPRRLVRHRPRRQRGPREDRPDRDEQHLRVRRAQHHAHPQALRGLTGPIAPRRAPRAPGTPLATVSMTVKFRAEPADAPIGPARPALS